MGLQAVRLHLFFSPIAASSCRGTPDPTLRLPVRPGSSGPGSCLGPGPDRSAGVGPVLRVFWLRTLGAGRQGRTGPGRACPNPAGPGHAQGFDCRQEGADAGPPHRGGRPGAAQSVSTPWGRCVAMCVCDPVVRWASRCGADPGSSRGLGVDAFAPLCRRCAAIRTCTCARTFQSKPRHALPYLRLDKLTVIRQDAGQHSARTLRSFRMPAVIPPWTRP
jgi:hypothetical protein